jgi:hypothetical protein
MFNSTEVVDPLQPGVEELATRVLRACEIRPLPRRSTRARRLRPRTGSMPGWPSTASLALMPLSARFTAAGSPSMRLCVSLAEKHTPVSSIRSFGLAGQAR